MTTDSHKKLLIVDDMATTRMLVHGMFSRQGYQVLQAANGAEAVALFDAERPDIVLLDVVMPVMDGFDACRHIRTLDRDEGTPVIMLTGAEDVDAIEKAFDAGATDFITKPINWPLLSQRIRYADRTGQLVREVRQNRLRQASALRLAQLGFWSWSPDDDTLEWSEGCSGLTGCASEGMSTLDGLIASVHADDRERVRREFATARTSDLRLELEFRFFGERILRLTGERGAEGRDFDRFFGAVQNVTDTRQAQALVDYLAQHDELTGLGNRRLFSQALRSGIDKLRLGDDGVLLVGWIDLSRFYRHNDQLGEDAGNTLLRQVAQRLRLQSHSGEVARVGGDEFAVLLQDDDSATALHRFEHLMNMLDQPFKVDGQETFLTFSAGVSWFPEHAADPEYLITLAHEAQRLARSQGRRIVQSGEVSAQPRNNTLELERKLRRALGNGEFHLVYQPQLELRRGKIVGAEALLRWRHPERGLVSPVEFIPILEECGLIATVGAWVIESACQQARRWELAGTPLRVGINLSARQFHDPGLFDTITAATLTSGVSAHNIELEITESLAMENPDHAIALLQRLRELGYKIAIDDFGIGYSSLEYLLRFPLDTIKIDRAFVMRITESYGDRSIVRAITAIAQTLALSTIAEGIEDQRQCDFLEALGVSEIQGFLIGRPMLPADLQRQLDAPSARPAGEG